MLDHPPQGLRLASEAPSPKSAPTTTNVQNRSPFSAPDTNPYSTNFGRVTSQTPAVNRFIQIQGRIQF